MKTTIRPNYTLRQKSCKPLIPHAKSLKGHELDLYMSEIPSWRVINEHHLFRSFTFSDFAQALYFVNQIGELAEGQGHHPDILLTWGRADIAIHTHDIDGLWENDFILAAKIDFLQENDIEES